MEDSPDSQHIRRKRYAGDHPRAFSDKYKELQPEKYAGEVEKIIASGRTPAGMHRPICVQEILDFLRPAPGETGFDATLGYGGHSRALLEKILPGGHLFATDVDPIEMPKTVERLAKLGFGPEVFSPRAMNFAGAASLVGETPGGRGFDFILADLGVSSMQLDDPARGFTFKNGGPLDLRLNPERGKPVADLLTEWSAAEIEKMLTRFADEPHAALLAAAIHAHAPRLRTTTALAGLVRRTLEENLTHGDASLAVSKALPRVFQAFRIAVNGELSALDQLLRVLPFIAAPGGRIAILTFHPGEDDRVRRAFDDGRTAGVYQDISAEIRPSREEMYSNPRSKSARLRCAVRV